MVIKTLCPFCSFGCQFGVVFNDFGIKGVEYISEGSSGGRLCPRGSAAALYLNHLRRLYTPMKSGKPLDWQKVTKELKTILEKIENVAVCFDRNITIEDYGLIVGLCKQFGIENIASTYFEPEIFLKKFIDINNPFSLGEIDNAQMVIVIGDIFNYVPMISKTLINWKLGNRKNRLIVIDSITTHTSVFANNFLKVKVNTEPLLLLALAQERIEGVDYSIATGISDTLIKEISNNFKSAKDGLIVIVLPFAHTYDPILLAESLTRLSQFSGKKVMPFFEFAGFSGNQYFGSIINLAKKKKIKYLFNFGEFFPFYYPQIAKDLKGVGIISTSPMKFNDFTILPVALNLEKAGTIITTFGKKSLSGEIKPASGAKKIDEILKLIGGDSQMGEVLQEPQLKIDVKEQAQRLLEGCSKKKKKFILIGEKIAFNFMGFFEKEMIKLNSTDAKQLGVKKGDTVFVESKNRKIEFVAKLTMDVDSGFATVPVETSETKGIFDYEIDNSIINFVPTEVEIWRKG